MVQLSRARMIRRPRLVTYLDQGVGHLNINDDEIMSRLRQMSEPLSYPESRVEEAQLRLGQVQLVLHVGLYLDERKRAA